MSDIPPINLTTKAPSGVNSNGVHPRPVNGQAAAPGDTVEISELGQRLSTLASDAGVRLEKVQTIRQAILDGTYETPAKLEAAVSRLVEVLRDSEPHTSDIGRKDA